MYHLSKYSAHRNDHRAEEGVSYKGLCKIAELFFIFHKIHKTGWKRYKNICIYKIIKMIVKYYTDCLAVVNAAHTPSSLRFLSSSTAKISSLHSNCIRYSPWALRGRRDLPGSLQPFIFNYLLQEKLAKSSHHPALKFSDVSSKEKMHIQ